MRRANMGLGSCGSGLGARTPSMMPSRSALPGRSGGFTAPPRIFPRPTSDVPLTFAACPPGYSTHKIAGESKCCKTGFDEQGHVVQICIEKAGVNVPVPCNDVSDCPLGQHCINGKCL